MESARFLVTGGSQGIGAAIVAHARKAGHEVVFTGRKPEAIETVARKEGAHGIAADITNDADNARVVDLCMSKMGGVDVLIDCVGGTSIDANLRLMALGGRIVSVGRLAANSGIVDLDHLALRRLKLIGVTFRTRSLQERIDCVQRCAEDLLEPLAQGKLQAVVEKVFPVEEVAAAHDYMARNAHVGKIALEFR